MNPEQLKTDIEKARNDALELAKETLDQGEIMACRSLVDIAERLTKVGVSISSPGTEPEGSPVGMTQIFARHKGERFTAELDQNRINGGRGLCVNFKNNWLTASAAAVSITKNNVNGWRFWKYYRVDGKTGLIDELRS